MICICGLGNPGEAHKNNRHNLGFMAIDFLKDLLMLPKFERKFSGLMSKGMVNEKQIMLFKPMLFMNKSGESLALLCNFYKLDLENLLVIYDDIELKFGVIKHKKAGGSAGHNGIRSIDSKIGKDYYRLKVGVDRPEHDDVAGYVLSDFAPNDNLETLLNNVANEVALFTQGRGNA